MNINRDSRAEKFMNPKMGNYILQYLLNPGFTHNGRHVTNSILMPPIAVFGMGSGKVHLSTSSIMARLGEYHDVKNMCRIHSESYLFITLKKLEPCE